MWKGLHHYQTMQCPVDMSENGTFRDATYQNDDQLETIAALRALNAELVEALKLIFEVHPTRNTKEDYAEAVREIASTAIQKAEAK
jgi:hypothetical protein